jgi:hypothetical protein
VRAGVLAGLAFATLSQRLPLPAAASSAVLAAPHSPTPPTPPPPALLNPLPVVIVPSAADGERAAYRSRAFVSHMWTMRRHVPCATERPERCNRIGPI